MRIRNHSCKDVLKIYIYICHDQRFVTSVVKNINDSSRFLIKVHRLRIIFANDVNPSIIKNSVNKINIEYLVELEC